MKLDKDISLKKLKLMMIDNRSEVKMEFEDEERQHMMRRKD